MTRLTFARMTGGLGVACALLASVAASTPEVVVERVIPSKVLYRLNERASARVAAANVGDATWSGTLLVEERRGLGESRCVARIPAALPPGKPPREWTVRWNVGPWMYGRELRATLVDAGGTAASAREFYQVADQWLRVNLVTGWTPGEGMPADLGPFETYSNHAMQFAWAPDDFSDMTPDVPTWYSGQAMYRKSQAELKARVAAQHAWGGKLSTYAKYMYGGPVGFEFARRHPEWVLREEDGSYFNYASALSPLDLARPVTDKQPFWQYGVVDFTDPAVVEFGAREIADSAARFGWDGVMFDGHFFVHDGNSWDGPPTNQRADPDVLSARNTRLCREIIRKQHPDFAFWYNGTYRRWGGRLELVIAGGPQAMEACLEDPNSSLLVEKQGPGFVTESWRHWYDWYADQPGYGEVVRKYASVVNSGWLWNMDVLEGLPAEEAKAARGAWVAAGHLGALFLSRNLHPCWNTSFASRPFSQFMTRYSDLLWATDIQPIEAAETFRVQSERPLWWERAGYVKRCGPTKAGSHRALYLLHLMNTTTTEKPVWSLPDDPPAATGVEVSLRLPSPGVVEEAWALRPYEWGEQPTAPVSVEPPLRPGPDAASVRIPPFHYYTLVVFQIRETQGEPE